MKILTQEDLERFWSKIDTTSSTSFYNGKRCWEWVASCNRKGYGTLRIGSKIERAHRISWTVTNGTIPNNMHVLHHCDNPKCVRDSHLFLGTNQNNADDREMKGRGNHDATRGKKNGHYTHPEKTPRGEDNSASKLTLVQVREIRQRYARRGIGGETSTKLAKEFGVSQPLILLIAKNKLWKE
jgi:hypothetical protein